MKKDTRRTPNGKIKAALRQLWLRSRERASACKDQQYTCQRCFIKQSKAKGKEVKIEVHHKHGVLNWDKLIDDVRDMLLCDPQFLEVLCVECHKKETYKEEEINADRAR